MSNPKFLRFAWIALGACSLVIAAVAGTLYFPYKQTVTRTESQLADALRTQTRLLLQLVKTTGAKQPADSIWDSEDETLIPMLAVQSVLRDYSTLTQFTVGRREGDDALVLLSFENSSIDPVRSRLPLNSHPGTPMSQALAGNTGTFIGADYDGRKVLSAYQWVPELSVGLVAKIPLAEIREPYLHAVMFNTLAWIVVLAVVAVFFAEIIKPVRKRLAYKESEHRAIFNSANDGIIVVDDEGNIRSFNPAARIIFGYRLTEVINKSLWLLISAEGQYNRNPGLQNLLENQAQSKTGEQKFQARRKDGTAFTANVLFSQMYLEDERLYTAIIRDMTVAQQAAREVLEAKDAAEAATQAKSQFLANMSHEIRAPMNGVIGMLDVLRDTPLNADQMRYLDLTQESATSLLTIVNDILDLSKIESGRLTLETIPFDLHQLVGNLIDLFTQKATTKGLKLQSRLDSGVPAMVCSDPVRLRQVLTNLVDNAIKFTAEGDVELHITKTGETATKYQLDFAVKDSGCGVSEGNHAELFKPFSQADLSVTRVHGGTGLGLSICHQLVELLGGEIQCSSELGKGSTFCFSIALAKPEALSGTSTQQPVNVASAPPAVAAALTSPIAPSVHSPPAQKPLKSHSSEKFRVLVADDNEINRVLCRELLKQFGYGVVTVADGQQVLDALEESAFDLILMDCRMPVLDGYATTRQIRERESRLNLQRIPIVALTAHAFEDVRESSLAAGMDGFLSKPFRAGQLKDMLAKWLPQAAASTAVV